MKTAMQELIDEIKEAVPYFKMDIYQENFNKALEKEKEQIMNAYNFGQQIPYFGYAEEYYNQTYNQNK
jgi:molybdopterin synthase catalytic subunit